jgi:two-component system, OmpR family, response regulator
MAMSKRELRVYLVEDSPIIRNLLTELMQATGANIVGHSGNAREALADIDQLRPDVITVDILLKNGSGFDVLKKIAEATDPPLRIVLTNYTMPAYREAAQQLGAEYFFDKATEIREVLTVLASTMRNSDGSAIAA